MNSTVRQVSEEGFKPGQLLGKPGDYPEPLTPVRVGIHDAHVRLSAKSPWLAVYRTEDGTVIGLPADDLAWLRDITGMQLARRRRLSSWGRMSTSVRPG